VKATIAECRNAYEKKMKLFIKVLLTIFLTSLISIPFPVNAWGDKGHKTVGQIAQNFLRPDIERKVANLLQDESFDGQLPLATLWADDIKYKRGNPFAFWSAPLHYIDTLDDPSRSCSVYMERDCLDGRCIVSGRYLGISKK